MVYSFPPLLMLRQPPDAQECVIVHFADKKAVNVIFAAGCLISVYSALQTKESWKPFLQFGASRHQLLGVL